MRPAFGRGGLPGAAVVRLGAVEAFPGGATATRMIPEGMPEQARAGLLDPAIMGPPIVWLASPEAARVHDQRIVASRFEEWLAAR
jgi:hypothetical protein